MVHVSGCGGSGRHHGRRVSGSGSNSSSSGGGWSWGSGLRPVVPRRGRPRQQLEEHAGCTTARLAGHDEGGEVVVAGSESGRHGECRLNISWGRNAGREVQLGQRQEGENWTEPRSVRCNRTGGTVSRILRGGFAAKGEKEPRSRECTLGNHGGIWRYSESKV